jgi:hypothetical protein
VVISSYSFHFNLQLKWVGHVVSIFENGIPKRDMEGRLAGKGPPETEEQMRRGSEVG